MKPILVRLGVIWCIVVVIFGVQSPSRGQGNPDDKKFCAVSFGGQDFYISGGGGGLFYRPAPQPNEVDFTKIFQSNGDEISSVLTSISSPAKDVAIIVADDFTGTPISILSANGQPTPTPNPLGLQISHGEMVLNHVRVLLASTNQYKEIQTGSIDVWQSSANKVYLATVETSDRKGTSYDTALIKDGITKTIANLELSFGLRRFVINMSFSVLPCDFLQTWEKYVQQSNTQCLRDLETQIY